VMLSPKTSNLHFLSDLWLLLLSLPSLPFNLVKVLFCSMTIPIPFHIFIIINR
jgi:hypothetical protein